MVEDNLHCIHAYATFLQIYAERSGNSGGLSNGEAFGRVLAHQVLTDALEWLKANEVPAS